MDILNRGTVRWCFRRILPWPKPAYVKTSNDQCNIAVNFHNLIADFPSKKVSTGNPPGPQDPLALCFCHASAVCEAEVVTQMVFEKFCVAFHRSLLQVSIQIGEFRCEVSGLTSGLNARKWATIELKFRQVELPCSKVGVSLRERSVGKRHEEDESDEEGNDAARCDRGESGEHHTNLRVGGAAVLAYR